MPSLRFLFAAALVLGGCNVLWAPFTSPNECGKHGLVCDGVSDLAGADLAGSDAGISPVIDGPWVIEKPAGLPFDPTIKLRGVTGTARATDIWAVGEGGYVMHRNLNGQWTELRSVGSGKDLNHVAFQGALKAMAIGDGATLIGLPLSGGSTTEQLVGTATKGIWFPRGGLAGVVCGGSSVWTFQPGGMTWSSVLVPASLQLNAVAAVTNTRLWFAAESGTIALYSNGTWYQGALGATNLGWRGVWVNSADPKGGVWFVGDSGEIGNTNDEVSPPLSGQLVKSPTQVTLWDIAGSVDGKYMWAVGAKGTIVRWDAATTRWEQETMPTGISGDLRGVFVSDTDVWAVGDGHTVLHRVALAP